MIKRHLLIFTMLCVFSTVFSGCAAEEPVIAEPEPIPGFEAAAEEEEPEPEPEPVIMDADECLALWGQFNSPEYNRFLRYNYEDPAEVPQEGMSYGIYYGEGNIRSCVVTAGVRTGDLLEVHVLPEYTGWVWCPEMETKLTQNADGSLSFLSNQILWGQGCIEGYPVEVEGFSQFSGKVNTAIYKPAEADRLPPVQVIDKDNTAYVSYPEVRPEGFPEGEFAGILGVSYEDADGDGNTDIIVKEKYGEKEVELTYRGFSPEDPPGAQLFFLKGFKVL